MSQICDHRSVGIFVWQGGRLLLIRRARYPKAYAIPAGHVDQHGSFEDAARAELKEEVGLEALSLTLVAEGRKENRCRREGGSWHEWRLYEADVAGEVVRSFDETLDADFYTKDEIRALAARTEAYLGGKVTETAWEAQPGLEPVMYEWFIETGTI